MRNFHVEIQVEDEHGLLLNPFNRVIGDDIVLVEMFNFASEKHIRW